MTSIATTDFASLSTDEKLILIYQALEDHKEQERCTTEDIYETLDDHDSRITCLEFKSVESNSERAGREKWWSSYKEVALVFITLALYKTFDYIAWVTSSLMG